MCLCGSAIHSQTTGGGAGQVLDTVTFTPGSRRVVADGAVERVALAGDEAGVRIVWRKSSVEARYVVPAAETTFSSIMIEPMSSAPNASATWPIFMPCVTHDDWMWSTLSR